MPRRSVWCGHGVVAAAAQRCCCVPVQVEEHSSALTCWRLLVLVAVLHSALIVPFRVAFSRPSHGNIFWFELVMDGLFLVDVFLQFNIAFRNVEGGLVTDRSLIARRYLSSWFIFDLISALPLELVAVLTGHLRFTWSGILAARLLKFFRLLRLVRLLRLGRLIRALEARFSIPSPLYRIGRFICFFTLTAHWAACVFYSLGSYALTNGHVSWITDVGLEGEGDFHLYVTSLYWSLTTITTIGYGDVSALSWETRLFGVVAMTIGTGIFSFAITQVVSMLRDLNVEQRKFRKKMAMVEEYMAYRLLPEKLRRRVREFFTYSRRVKSALVFGERGMLNELSKSLREQVGQALNQRMFDFVPGMCREDSHFNVELMLSMEPRCFPPGETLCSPNSPNSELYLIVSGQVERVSDVSCEILSEGAHFGGLSLLNLGYTSHDVSICTLTWCTLQVLTRESLLKTLRRFPKIRMRILHDARKRLTVRSRGGRGGHAYKASKDEVQLRINLDEMIEDEQSGFLDPSQLLGDSRFDLSSSQEPNSMADADALLSLIGRLGEDQAKALLQTGESMLLRFSMQQTMLASVGQVIGQSVKYQDTCPPTMRRESANQRPRTSFESDAALHSSREEGSEKPKSVAPGE